MVRLHIYIYVLCTCFIVTSLKWKLDQIPKGVDHWLYHKSNLSFFLAICVLYSLLLSLLSFMGSAFVLKHPLSHLATNYLPKSSLSFFSVLVTYRVHMVRARWPNIHTYYINSTIASSFMFPLIFNFVFPLVCLLVYSSKLC